MSQPKQFLDLSGSQKPTCSPVGTPSLVLCSASTLIEPHSSSHLLQLPFSSGMIKWHCSLIVLRNNLGQQGSHFLLFDFTVAPATGEEAAAEVNLDDMFSSVHPFNRPLASESCTCCITQPPLALGVGIVKPSKSMVSPVSMLQHPPG